MKIRNREVQNTHNEKYMERYIYVWVACDCGDNFDARMCNKCHGTGRYKERVDLEDLKNSNVPYEKYSDILYCICVIAAGIMIIIHMLTVH